MKISEAISRLNVLCAEYGDLDVVIRASRQDADNYPEIMEVASLEIQNVIPRDGEWLVFEDGNTHQVVSVF